MNERSLQAAVLELAGLLGWATYHTFDSRRSAPGFPDLVLVRPPRIVFAELKAGRGRLSLDQHRWLDLLAGCPGVEAYLWTPAQWRAGEIERALR